ncbi:hypothetical protein GCK32_018945, partial [Trichostrongylus colubriformis]
KGQLSNAVMRRLLLENTVSLSKDMDLLTSTLKHVEGCSYISCSRRVRKIGSQFFSLAKALKSGLLSQMRRDFKLNRRKDEKEEKQTTR